VGKLFTLPSELASQISRMRKPKVRACAFCGKEFVTVGRGLYCSPSCHRKVVYRRNKARKEQRA
jgi:hypothetical protein